MLSNTRFRLYIIIVICLNGIPAGMATCFFPTELQGDFIMQSTYLSSAQSQVQYSQVNITPEAIPIWGLCHRRIANNVILMDSFSDTNCIRCFQITLRSRNVLQVKTESLDKCYMSEEAAIATCPRDNDANSHVKEILLYKTKEIGGEEIRKEYCPIHGRFTFMYNVNDGSENKLECDNYESELNTCSYPLLASSLNLQFKRCSFHDHDITFFCLGDWEGPGKQRYLALYDARETTENKPQYRCAMYHIDSEAGKVYIAFSSDSTCTNNLHNSTYGYETLELKQLPEARWPQKVLSSTGRFPEWTQGRWQHMTVDSNVITYRDHSTFQTLKIRILGPENINSERLLVFIHDECGGESYNCIWLKKRSSNVLEFQLGINSSAVYNDSLCYNSNFPTKMWITQGRLERLKESPCPITGQYTGFIPDAMGLCAKLSSDCKSPEIMYYTLSECAHNDVYEEREYRCLGQWEEKNVTYTYTQRRDTGIYECFVGLIVSVNEIYIKEAGEHCERNVAPVNRGMKLSLEGECTGSNPSPIPWDNSSPYLFTHRPPTVTWRSTRLPQVTKPWKPITAPPSIKNEVLNGGTMKMNSWQHVFTLIMIVQMLKCFLVCDTNGLL